MGAAPSRGLRCNLGAASRRRFASGRVHIAGGQDRRRHLFQNRRRHYFFLVAFSSLPRSDRTKPWPSLANSTATWLTLDMNAVSETDTKRESRGFALSLMSN